MANKVQNQLNELNGVPSIVGGGTMSSNGAESTNPSLNQLSNYENGSMGGMESIGNGGRMYMDWINGKGPYGEKGRDHAFAISSLAITNPYAAAAVLGVMAGSAVVYGIATSAYVRARNAQRRLRDIYNGVIKDGYKLESTGFGIFGLWSGKGEKYGHKQFRQQLMDDLNAAMKTIEDNGLKHSQYRTTLSNRDRRQELESTIAHILSESYKKLYLPKQASESLDSEIETLKAANPQEYARALREKLRYGTKSEKTYSQIVNEMAEKGVNAPIYNQANEYIKLIQEAGDDVIKDYQTKMAYALKKGGNRATAAKNKLVMLWKKYMKAISNKIYEEVSDFLSSEEYKNYKVNIDDLYGVSSIPFTQSIFEGDVNIGDLWITHIGGVGSAQQPVLLRVVDVNDASANATLVVCNSDIAGNPILVTRSIDYINNAQSRREWRRMRLTQRNSIGTNTVGRIYRINYQFKGMDAYIISEKFDASSGILTFHYYNSYIPSIAWGPYQRTKKITPNAILGEVVEMSTNESAETPFYARFNKLFEEKVFEADGGDASSNDESNNEQSEPDNIEEVAGKLKDSVFIDKGVYLLGATKEKRIVHTDVPMPGKVDVVGEKMMPIEEWAKLDPYEIPEMEDMIESRGEIMDMDMSLNPSDIKKYKDFGQRYLDGRYEKIVTLVLDKHKKELNTYSVDYNRTNKYAKLLNTKGETTASMLSDMGSFRKYIVDGIGGEDYGKPLDRNPIESQKEDSSVSDASSNDSSTSESLSAVYGRMLNESLGRYYSDTFYGRNSLFEAGSTQDNSNNKSTTTNTQKNNTETTQVGGNQTNVKQEVKTSTDKSTNVAGDQTTNKVTSTEVGGDYIAKICAEHLDRSTHNSAYITVINNYGVSSDISDNADVSNNNIDNGGNNNGGDDENIKKDDKKDKKFEEVNEIPEFIPTVCEEIRKYVDSFNNMMEKGKTRGALRSAPSAFTVNEEKWNALIGTEAASNKKELRENESKKLNDVYIHKDGEIVVYLDKINGDKEKTFSFIVDNYTIDLKCEVGEIEQCNLKLAYRGDSDESHVADDIKCGFNDGNVYAISKDELSKAASSPEEEDNTVNDSLNAYYDEAFKVFELGYDSVYEEDNEDSEVEDKGGNYDYVVLTKTNYKDKKVSFIHFDIEKGISEDYIGSDLNAYISKLEATNELEFEKSGAFGGVRITSFTDFKDASNNNLSDGEMYSMDEIYYKNVVSHLLEDKSTSYAKKPLRFTGDGDDGKTVNITLGVGTSEKNLILPYIFMNGAKFVILDANTEKFQKDKCYLVTREYVNDTPVLKEVADSFFGDNEYDSMALRQIEDITDGYDLKFEVAGGKSGEMQISADADNKKEFVVNFFDINPDAFTEVEDTFGELKQVKPFDSLEKGDTFEVSKEEFSSNFEKTEEKQEESVDYAYNNAMRLYEADGDEEKLVKLTVLSRDNDVLKVAVDSGDVYTIKKDNYEKLKSIKHGEKTNAFSDETPLVISKDKHFVTEDNIKKLTELRNIVEKMKSSDANGERLSSVLSSGAYANTNISSIDRLMKKLGMSGIRNEGNNVYDYILVVIDSLMNKRVPSADKNRERNFVYFDEKGNPVKKKIKLTKVDSDGLHITDISDNKEYTVGKDAYNDVIISESNRDRVCVDYVKLMKHNLYGYPINEAIVINCDPMYVYNLLSVLIGYNGEGEYDNINSLLNILTSSVNSAASPQNQGGEKKNVHQFNTQQQSQTHNQPDNAEMTTDASGNNKMHLTVGGGTPMDVTQPAPEK